MLHKRHYRSSRPILPEGGEAVYRSFPVVVRSLRSVRHPPHRSQGGFAAYPPSANAPGGLRIPPGPPWLFQLSSAPYGAFDPLRISCCPSVPLTIGSLSCVLVLRTLSCRNPSRL